MNIINMVLEIKIAEIILSFLLNIFLKNIILRITKIIDKYNRKEAFFCENNSVCIALPYKSAVSESNLTPDILTINGVIVRINEMGKKKSGDFSLK
ncbi:hypothetical protein [Clostridium chromiireducens]|uniref:hypothetical protein n=1 Tax=Clostridium chromiireducens TaxID=225345 RepID=UPI00311AA435